MLILLTYRARNIVVQTTKHNLALHELLRDAFFHDEVFREIRDRGRLLPFDNLTVDVPYGAGGGADGVHDEVGVLGEEDEEPLADGA